eukprot:TRINITY_DN1660_c2_g2_i1.p1 TRINITY_DN1660_c2_g2~~TRINITY_DN1660_c2_g2_i1.p1  ORF type:complete len:268 (-),score=41.92 TRINITY_DN1660_c2_g2_i1:267-1070(-)
MANRRCLHALTRHCSPLLSSNPIHTYKSHSLHSLYTSQSLQYKNHNSIPHHRIRRYDPLDRVIPKTLRHFSSKRPSDEDEDEEEEEEEEDDDDDVDSDDEGELEDEGDNDSGSKCIVRRANSETDKEEAAAIGYQVIGPLDPSDRPFKPWEPLFAVVQIGSHQFKVSNGDSIFTERLKFCEVNDKLILNRVLMLGSKTQTIIGRPILPNAAVHAVVEEHALDAKVIIFKKKRRKNYRRTKGHRQELTKLRITDIQGIEMPQKAVIAA